MIVVAWISAALRGRARAVRVAGHAGRGAAGGVAGAHAALGGDAHVPRLRHARGSVASRAARRMHSREDSNCEILCSKILQFSIVPFSRKTKINQKVTE